MQTWEGIQAKLAQVGKVKVTGGVDWNRPRTRDEMITHFETDWDKLKNFWAANPETAASSGDAFNLQKFNTFDEWKNWFMGQHPTNEIVMGEFGQQQTTPTGQQPSSIFNQPTTPMGQPPQVTAPTTTIGQPQTTAPATTPNMPFKPPPTGFDTGSNNYQTWQNHFGNMKLPSDTLAQNKFSGMTTGWDNPYYKKLFNK